MESSRQLAMEGPSQSAFFGVMALLFAASAVVTVAWCGSMRAMGEMHPMGMHGGSAASMGWTPMPGHTWSGTAASFLGMWTVMMVAMMLPSLVPMLWRYRRAVGWTGEPRLGRLTAVVGFAYFSVWTVLGVAVSPLGAALVTVLAKQPVPGHAAPIAVVAGLVLLARGVGL